MPFAGMTIPCSILLLLVLLSPTCHGDGAPTQTHNITAILAASPEFSEFSAALAATNLTAKIDERHTITVLAVDNAAVGRLRALNLQPDAIVRVLSLHVLLDYYDDAKLKAINATPSTQATSLFQASGAAPGGAGIVNITSVAAAGGRRRGVAFSAADAGGHVVFYEKSVKELPYDIAILHVSGAMESPSAEGRALAPSPAPVAAPARAPAPEPATAPSPTPSPKNQTAPPPKPAGAPSSQKNQTAPPPKPTGVPTSSPEQPADGPEAGEQPPADEDGGHKNDAGGTAAPWSVGAVLAAAMPAVVFLLL